MELKYNICFNIAALALFAVLLACFYYKKSMKTMQNRVFLVMLYAGVFTTLADIADAFSISFPQQAGEFLLSATSYLFFITLNLMPLIYALYVITLTDTNEKMLKLHKFSEIRRTPAVYLLGIPIFINIFIIVGNYWTNWLFYYDSSYNYKHGPALIILYGTAAYFLILGMVYTYRHRNIISFGKRLAIYSFFPLTGLPILFQAFFPQHLIAPFAIALCLLLMLVTIQNQSEVIDGLTGLYNRKALFSVLPIHYYHNRPFTVVSILLTDYSFLRKTFGMDHMTKILNQITEKLEQLPIKEKIIYYMGEAHIAITIPNTSVAETETFPQMVQGLFQHSWKHEGVKVRVIPRICVIKCPDDAETIESLVDYLSTESDRKSEKVNGIVYAANLLHTAHSRTVEIEHAIADGLKNGNFKVYYQAIYCNKRKLFNSAEALLRLSDPVLGDISPEEFIPIAERNGSIVEIGNWAFSEVCEFLTQYNLSGFGVDYIEINVSVVQCMQEKLGEQFLEILKKFELPADRINLEITESVAAHSFEILSGNMKVLSNAGIKFSLDDYGTGYSNMQSIVSLPFNYVKIDRSIVSAIDNEKGRIAMAGTIAMLKELNLRVIAEGVETPEQRDLLIEMGCDYLQGFFFSPPIPKIHFLNLLSGVNLISEDKDA